MRKLLAILALGLGLTSASAETPFRYIGDANYTALNSDYILGTTTLSAARTITIPLRSRTCIQSNATPSCPSRTLEVIDTAGVVTSTNTLSISPPTGDTINGSSSPIVLSAAYSRITLWALDGSGKWIASTSFGATAGLAVGTSTISGGTTNQLLYDNGGTLGEVTKCNTGVYITNSSGVPSCATTVTIAGPIKVATGQTLGFTASSTISDGSTDGNIVLSNAANNAFNLLQFGGTTSSFPALRRSGTLLQFRLADNSGDSPIQASTATFPSIATDSGHTDNTVCVDSASGLLYKGSGAVGICLGTSSARFKQDITPLAPGLAQVKALFPVRYRYITGYGDNGVGPKYGFTAEQVAEVIPELVGHDTDGKPNTIDWAGIVPVLVKAIQEQQKEIDSLKTAKAN